jgi:hypothetical protein
MRGDVSKASFCKRFFCIVQLYKVADKNHLRKEKQIPRHFVTSLFYINIYKLYPRGESNYENLRGN